MTEPEIIIPMCCGTAMTAVTRKEEMSPGHFQTNGWKCLICGWRRGDFYGSWSVPQTIDAANDTPQIEGSHP